MNHPIQRQKMIRFGKRNFPICVLFIGFLIPTLRLGFGFLLALVALTCVAFAIFMVLQVIGLRNRYYGGFLVSTAVAVVFLASMATFNATYLTSPITALLILGALIGAKSMKLPVRDLLPSFTHLNWGVRSSYFAISAISLAAWVQISNGIMTGSSVDSSKLFADVPLLTGLVRSIMDGQGLAAPFLSDFGLRYHWMSYGFSAWFAEVSGIDPILVTFGAVPFIAFALSLTLASATAALISNSKWVPLLASTALGLVGAVGGWRFAQISIWDWGSPSTIVSAFLGLAVTFVILSKGFSNIYVQVSLAFALALGAGLTKISMGVVLALTATIMLGLSFFFSRFAANGKSPLVAIQLGVGIAAILTFSDTGSELMPNPALGLVSEFNPIRVFEVAISETSFILSSAFLWAGIALLIATRKWMEFAYLWGLTAAVTGQLIYFLLVGPAANDRLFAVAGMTIAIPIIATLIGEIKFRKTKNAFGKFWLLVGILSGSTVIIGKAAWSDSFDQRPILLIILVLSIVLLVSWFARGIVVAKSKSVAILTTSVLFLMLLSVSAPQALKLFDERQVSINSGISVPQILSQNYSRTNADVWRIEFQKLNKQLASDHPIAIWRSQSVPGIIGRWASYDLNPVDYVSSEVDIEGLVSREAQRAAKIRRALIVEAISGSQLARARLCEDGLTEIIILGFPDNPRLIRWESAADGVQVGVLQLECFF